MRRRFASSMPPRFASLMTRRLASSATARSSLDFKVIALPMLSPVFEKADLIKWHKAEGDFCEMHDLLFDVKTNTLTLTDRDLRFLEIESHEEGYIARIFESEGTQNMTPGMPLAIMVEEQDEISFFEKMTAAELSAEELEDSDFLYQAYTKTKM